MIVDSGTTKTVAGEAWITAFLGSLSEKERAEINIEPEERFFRFGNSVRYPSKEEVAIPIKLGKLETHLYISIV